MCQVLGQREECCSEHQNCAVRQTMAADYFALGVDRDSAGTRLELCSVCSGISVVLDIQISEGRPCLVWLGIVSTFCRGVSRDRSIFDRSAYKRTSDTLPVCSCKWELHLLLILSWWPVLLSLRSSSLQAGLSRELAGPAVTGPDASPVSTAQSLCFC